MKAISIPSYGDTSVIKLSELPIHTPADDEVLIRNEFIGINYIDTYMREGIYKASLPFVLGFEGSGEVVSVGSEVKKIKPGTKVGYVDCKTGAYAEYTIVNVKDVIALPDKIDTKTAAAVLLQGLTAHYLSHATYPIKKGDKVLIHAGAGGVGQLLIQMAKQRGAYIFTTVSSPAKQEYTMKLGADLPINYTNEDFLQVIKATTNEGIEVVYDSVGKNTFEKSLQCLKKRGMLVSYGQSSGVVPNFSPLLLSSNSLYLTRPKLGDYIASEAEKEQRANDLFNAIIHKKLTFHIGEILPLSEAAKAHQLLQSRHTMGKILLHV